MDTSTIKKIVSNLFFKEYSISLSIILNSPFCFYEISEHGPFPGSLRTVLI